MNKRYLLLVGKWDEVRQDLGEFETIEELEKFVSDEDKMKFAEEYEVFECVYIKSLSKMKSQ